MDKCPIEILGLIFEEACADDGLTGRSLSLVSRHIHDTSRRYAFRSIALYGPHQLSAFASLLDKADLEGRGIRHLYLTDRWRVWMEYLPGQDREQWHRERVAEDFHVDDASRKYSSTILRILKIASPTIQTLTLLLFGQYDEPLLSDAVSFPNLRELTIRSKGMAYNTQLELPQCLSLRRLHIIQGYALKRLIPQPVSRLAPLLTHLRISRLLPGTIVPIDFARDLRCMLQPYNAADATFPQMLERVLVQMLLQGFWGSDGGPDAQLVRSLSPRAAAVANPHCWRGVVIDVFDFPAAARRVGVEEALRGHRYARCRGEDYAPPSCDVGPSRSADWRESGRAVLYGHQGRVAGQSGWVCKHGLGC